ncbi:MAG: DUF1284 domain-containing protein [Thermodesulfovibrionales bacterium]
MPKIPSLRGHHLICLHFYRGEGYDEGFVSSLNSLVDRLPSLGANIVEGPDDVCLSCPNLLGARCGLSEDADEEIDEMDRFALFLLKHKAGDHVLWFDIKKMLPSIISTWYERCCLGCLWFDKCDIMGFKDAI